MSDIIIYDLDYVLEFAKMCYKGLLYNGEPYINHAIRTADNVKEFSKEPIYQAVALLHDVIEDGPALDVLEIKDKFGESVYNALHILTQDPNVSYDEYINRIAISGNEIAIIVKVADALDNFSTSMQKEEFKKAKKYRRVILKLAPAYMRLG